MKERVMLDNINCRAYESPKEMISEAENNYHAKISEITDEINSTYVLLAQESVLDILNM